MDLFSLGLAALAFVRAWWKAAVGAAVIFPLAFALGDCSGVARERDRAGDTAAKAAAQALRRDAAAKEQAALERQADTADIAARRQERQDALKHLPDAEPSPRRRALACQRLRDQGADTTAVPGCR